MYFCCACAADEVHWNWYAMAYIAIYLSFQQCCGSGSALILVDWTRIRIENADSDWNQWRQKKPKKPIECFDVRSVSSLLRAEGFSLSSKDLYRGPGISHQNLDPQPDPDPHWPKMLDPDQDSHWNQCKSAALRSSSRELIGRLAGFFWISSRILLGRKNGLYEVCTAIKKNSDADRGSLSKIRSFPSRIQGQKDSGTRIRIKKFKYYYPKNCF
jgi:hypothetical protein